MSSGIRNAILNQLWMVWLPFMSLVDPEKVEYSNEPIYTHEDITTVCDHPYSMTASSGKANLGT